MFKELVRLIYCFLFQGLWQLNLDTSLDECFLNLLYYFEILHAVADLIMILKVLINGLGQLGLAAAKQNYIRVSVLLVKA